MARRYGVQTEEIILTPIGGLARLDRMPSGIAEFMIAIAGPLVNLAVAGLLLAVGLAFGLPLDPTTQQGPMALLGLLVFSNFALFAFNLLPAFPMDGGRILRSLLSLLVGDDDATRFAALLGQLIAALLALLAIFGPGQNLVLLLIALFVFFGAGQEAAFNRTRSLVRGRTVGEAMMVRVGTLAPQDSLEYATRLFLAGTQRDFPVVDAWGRLAGLLDRNALLRGLAEHGPAAAVLEAMSREVEPAGPEMPLEEALRRLHGEPHAALVVADEQGLLGMLTAEKLSQWIEVIRRL
jgi:CBS-domain-containing membrane protein